jgi:predicted amidohydrolase YtcJ
VLTHSNGDAAIGQFIDAVEKANERLGKRDRRPVLIQAKLFAKIKSIVSLNSVSFLHCSQYTHSIGEIGTPIMCLDTLAQTLSH